MPSRWDHTSPIRRCASAVDFRSRRDEFKRVWYYRATMLPSRKRATSAVTTAIIRGKKSRGRVDLKKIKTTFFEPLTDMTSWLCGCLNPLPRLGTYWRRCKQISRGPCTNALIKIEAHRYRLTGGFSYPQHLPPRSGGTACSIRRGSPTGGPVIRVRTV